MVACARRGHKTVISFAKKYKTILKDFPLKNNWATGCKSDIQLSPCDVVSSLPIPWLQWLCNMWKTSNHMLANAIKWLKWTLSLYNFLCREIIQQCKRVLYKAVNITLFVFHLFMCARYLKWIFLKRKNEVGWWFSKSWMGLYVVFTISARQKFLEKHLF